VQVLSRPLQSPASAIAPPLCASTSTTVCNVLVFPCISYLTHSRRHLPPAPQPCQPALLNACPDVLRSSSPPTPLRGSIIGSPKIPTLIGSCVSPARAPMHRNASASMVCALPAKQSNSVCLLRSCNRLEVLIFFSHLPSLHYVLCLQC